jgi:hypothetical protein
VRGRRTSGSTKAVGPLSETYAGVNIMSPKKGNDSHKQQSTLQIIAISALVIMCLSACNSISPLSATSPSPDSTVWRKVHSPLLPSNWAPTAETVWVRYTFAYGINPAVLMDGEYVTKPLSKTECREDVVKTTVLSDEMAQAAIQGVMPIDKSTLLLLQNEKPVTGDCVNMTQLPDPNLPETKELLAYYRAWFKYNGAFLDMIRKDHTDFIDWVMSNE